MKKRSIGSLQKLESTANNWKYYRKEQKNKKTKTMRQIALKLDRLSADAVITLANDIHEKMTTNATIFATPPIAMADLPAKRRGPQRYDFLETPTDLRSESIYGEAVALRWKKVANAKSYEVEYTKDPSIDSAWTRTPIVSASRTLIHGLALKEQYWFRVRATGTQGMVSGWSETKKQIVS
jgi:hypothetical protein